MAGQREPGSHVIRVNDGFFSGLPLVPRGVALTVDWREPDADGVYEPLVTQHDMLAKLEDIAREARALVDAAEGPGFGTLEDMLDEYERIAGLASWHH